MKDVIRTSKYSKRPKDYRFFEMFARLREIREKAGSLAKIDISTTKDENMRKYVRHMQESLPGELSTHKVELNKRFVFAMASLCFVLIGIPLGIRSQRKESTVGMAISLAVSLGYYVIVILMLSCEEIASIRPDILIWLPVVLCLVLSAKLVRRNL